ncbi:hypothetical protein GMMP15_900005 [Candidatus Magnetomoraceae bacterium gMMP-15]
MGNNKDIKIVLLVGAGVSSLLGFPLLKELLEVEINTLASKLAKAGSDKDRAYEDYSIEKALNQLADCNNYIKDLWERGTLHGGSLEELMGRLAKYIDYADFLRNDRFVHSITGSLSLALEPIIDRCKRTLTLCYIHLLNNYIHNIRFKDSGYKLKSYEDIKKENKDKQDLNLPSDEELKKICEKLEKLKEKTYKYNEEYLFQDDIKKELGKNKFEKYKSIFLRDAKNDNQFKLTAELIEKVATADKNISEDITVLLSNKNSSPEFKKILEKLINAALFTDPIDSSNADLENLKNLEKMLQETYIDKKLFVNKITKTLGEAEYNTNKDWLLKYSKDVSHSEEQIEKNAFEILKLLNELAGKNAEKKLDLFTTNYDTSFHYMAALEDNPIKILTPINKKTNKYEEDYSILNVNNYSKEAPKVKIHRLHGCVTWFRDEENSGGAENSEGKKDLIFEYSPSELAKECEDVLTQLKNRREKNRLKKYYNDKEIKSKKERGKKDTTSHSLDKDVKPRKQQGKKDIIGQWSDMVIKLFMDSRILKSYPFTDEYHSFRTSLETASHLLVWGFSFRDSEIVRIVHDIWYSRRGNSSEAETAKDNKDNDELKIFYIDPYLNKDKIKENIKEALKKEAGYKDIKKLFEPMRIKFSANEPINDEFMYRIFEKMGLIYKNEQV